MKKKICKLIALTSIYAIAYLFIRFEGLLMEIAAKSFNVFNVYFWDSYIKPLVFGFLFCCWTFFLKNDTKKEVKIDFLFVTILWIFSVIGNICFENNLNIYFLKISGVLFGITSAFELVELLRNRK